MAGESEVISSSELDLMGVRDEMERLHERLHFVREREKAILENIEESRHKAREWKRMLANQVNPADPTPNDRWQHRAEHMRCRTCMWFCPKAGEVGRCRRRAPIIGGYPVVFVTDWCGDHKLNEEAI